MTLQKEGNLKEAEAEYRAVLAQNPNYAEARANLAAVLARTDRYKEAVSEYESALRLAPQLTPILLNLGIAHYRNSEFAKAVDALKRYLERSPANSQARQLMGLSLLEMGKDKEAVELFERSVSEGAEDPALLYGLGLAYLRLQKPGVPALIERLAIIPKGAPASHLLRGQLLLWRGEFERAIVELELAATLQADLPRIQYSLGLCYLKLGLNKEALTAFESELRHAAGDFSTLYYLAYLHEAEGDLTRARARLDAALSLEPESAEGNTLLGKILVKEGRVLEALKPLELAVKKDPSDDEKRYQLGRAYQRLGRREDAAREFAESRRLRAEKLRKDRERIPKP
jgi:Flp pilus assembly protein TadD